MIPYNANHCPYPATTSSSAHPATDMAKLTAPLTTSTATLVDNIQQEQSKPSSSPVIASRIYPDNTPPTQAQIDIVRYTWERVSEIRLPDDDPNVSASHAFGLAFYDALFELDPNLKPLFTNIFQQARALAGMVSYIARAPNVTGPKPYRANSSPSLISACPTVRDRQSLPPQTGEIDRPPAIERALTIREINARKRKENNATTFSELIAQAAAVTNGNDGADNSEIQNTDNERLLYKLQELGSKHYFYDVQPEHFALVGPAVLSAIKARLRNEFVQEVADAWTVSHAYAAYHMKIGLETQAAWEQNRKRSTSKDSPLSTSKRNCNIQ